MLKTAMADSIAATMERTLKDPNFSGMFTSDGILEKLAFSRVADKDKPTETELAFAVELDKATSPLTTTASDADPAKACICGVKLAAGKDCTCGMNGCQPMAGGCGANCACGCGTKQAGVQMDHLIKSAFNSLMKASEELEEAGFEQLSANALLLVNDLFVEAKAKKDKKDGKSKAKPMKKDEKSKDKAKGKDDKKDDKKDNKKDDKPMKGKEKSEKAKSGK